ncbi:MAG: EFR1 family ferrodoxin [Syntrophomonadaceae bacterium]
MDKQVNLLYFSATGTTARVVQAIGEGLGGPVRERDVTHPYSRRDFRFGPGDLVVAGVPVYAGRVPDFLVDYLARVKGDHTPVVCVVVYGNRDYDDALLELKDIMENNGFMAVAAGAFIGEHSFTGRVATGRPDRQDLQIARDFGARLQAKLAAMDNGQAEPELIVKGNFPYKERVPKIPAIPVIGAGCLECGMCAESCPMQAINWKNFRDINGTKCILCCRCVKICPVQAVSIDHEKLDKVRQMLITKCQVRREPEIFL